MSRTDYFNDPDAPQAQRIVPAVTAFVLNDRDEVLLERRTDNGRWAMPGGVQEIGESISAAAVREVAEETGVRVQVVGMVGIYSNPGHVIAFADGEVRQEFSITLRAEPLGGTLRASSESFEVRWTPRSELDDLDIAPTTRLRLDRGFQNDPAPYIG
ncbi:NUDIX domain-containing protein [Kitasatospora sp. NPDC088351]|uniref:NUDIX domain-containing protein n=1 Tax=Kitasatospora sp. NPDC088351 TaxID=3155180 RepID=UPI00342AA2C6